MQWLINLFFKALEAVMVLCMVCMMVMVFGNVIMRYGFHSGFPISDELSRFCFFWVIFLGA
ncbi:TRAP transporter small permease, partial [uncultured Cedecea sp.]